VKKESIQAYMMGGIACASVLAFSSSRQSRGCTWTDAGTEDTTQRNFNTARKRNHMVQRRLRSVNFKKNKYLERRVVTIKISSSSHASNLTSLVNFFCTFFSFVP
jgi:hypothetical protein